ncbi:MAG: DUF2069 domain-containing protein [Pseudomonadales bacterium]|uniref:DUF2069 domain-containing protein n=1 Tax=Alcanivorax TaxID=59753 RepID=UPI0003B36A5B|nr:MULTISPECIES: DUF2069 domain-containing protein [unclassified Alcanivorax]MCG8436731.1 DUF2069 domain-containing protein [Pseudomonadales bacterium]MED5432833.1 DUF2069 domain-containing protein [Pseudomonadota bacterium]ERP86702.1 hypothetical protein Q670_05905 [Alcanivorax sp. P2S70]MEE2869838.1 DUF2069 domain-containing protein [Pseudomonadota bacterium]PNE02933.1 hypothetical protein A15D_01542 [Alcanivorax sp. MD8A]|tara:strand:- start:390 stop:758 length:369 start_codon:yes stop_codon:yes gene_type:complete
MILLLLRITYALLLLVGITGLFSLAPPDTHLVSTLIIAAVLYTPLIVMLPAVIDGNKRQATWLCFVLLFYFCGYAVQLLDPPPVRTLAIAKTTLTVMLFVLAAMQIRVGQQKAAQPQEPHAD